MNFLLSSFRHIGIPALVCCMTVLFSGCGGGGGGGEPASTSAFSSMPTNPNVDISSSGLITDQRAIGIPGGGAYPAKGGTLKDPVTGFYVTRVADKSELTGDTSTTARSALSMIVYSRYTATNTTGEYVLVHGDNSTSAWIYRVRDNKMMTVLRFNPSLGTAASSLGEVNELRWDYSGAHPYRLYFVGHVNSRAGHGERMSMSFYYTDFDPTTGTQSAPVLIRDFSADFPDVAANGLIMNDVEGDSSNDSRYWAWQVLSTSSSSYRTVAIVTYDKTNNTIVGTLRRSCAGITLPCVAIDTPAQTAPYMTRPNMVEMSPLGTRVVVDFDRAYTGNNAANAGTVADGPKAFLPDFSDPIRIGADATHSGWAWSADGYELFVSQNNRNDWIEAVDIRTATTARCTLIEGNSYGCGTKLVNQTQLDPGYADNIGYHFGKVYDRTKRGYVYMNTYAGRYGSWGSNQGLLVKVRDGSASAGPLIVRLGSTYNTTFDYRSEGSGALDFKGENIWTTANWGFTDGRGDVVRIALPTNLFPLLP